jgi:hypothetical protein
MRSRLEAHSLRVWLRNSNVSLFALNEGGCAGV